MARSTIDQFLADRVLATVQNLFQMVNVLDLLMIYQDTEEPPKLISPRI